MWKPEGSRRKSWWLTWPGEAFVTITSSCSSFDPQGKAFVLYCVLYMTSDFTPAAAQVTPVSHDPVSGDPVLWVRGHYKPSFRFTAH